MMLALQPNAVTEIDLVFKTSKDADRPWDIGVEFARMVMAAILEMCTFINATETFIVKKRFTMKRHATPAAAPAVQCWSIIATRRTPARRRKVCRR